MNLSDLKVGDRFIVAGVADVFTFEGSEDGYYTAEGYTEGFTIWTYDAECDLYEEDAPYDPPDDWRLPE